MGVKLRVVLWLLVALTWGYNFYLWGGLQETPRVGSQLMKEAPLDNPLAATYMYVGGKLNHALGLSEDAKQFAARKFPLLVAHPEDLEYLAVARFLSAQGMVGRAFYSLAPLLLVLSFIAHWLRPKQIRSFGVRR